MPVKNGVVVVDRVLPLLIDHYEIFRHGEWCTVMVNATGEVVFQGEGAPWWLCLKRPFKNRQALNQSGGISQPDATSRYERGVQATPVLTARPIARVFGLPNLPCRNAETAALLFAVYKCEICGY
ncbi:MAG: hypothetical protein V4614_09315 [Pseudomonadota bacterium]